MMHGREKSDSAIVAGKPTNNAVLTAAEPAERWARGNSRPYRDHDSRTSGGLAPWRLVHRTSKQPALPERSSDADGCETGARLT